MTRAPQRTRSRTGYQWFQRHPVATDIALMMAVASISVSSALSFQPQQSRDAPSSTFEWVVLVTPSLAIAARRAYPLAALGFATVAQMVLWTIIGDPFLSMAVVLYSAAAYGGPRGPMAAAVSSATLAGYTILGWSQGEAPGYAVFMVALLAAAAVTLGMNSAGRVAYAKAVLARAQMAEQRRLSDQERILSDERNRIARELHDVVAHGLSVMVVQASAGRHVIATNPDQAELALAQIETTGRAALSEMRQVLKAIRTDPSDSWRPALGLDGLDTLISEFTQTGLRVEFVNQQASDDADDELPATIELTAYRVIQEALTNVLKHAGPQASAQVLLSQDHEALKIAIVDDGRGKGSRPIATKSKPATDYDPSSPPASEGHGLLGIRERVEVFGGTLSARPRLDGGFELQVLLPIDGRNSG